MPLTSINPSGIPTPQTFTHVIVTTGTKLVFIAGQVPEDARGNLVGAGDMAAQARPDYVPEVDAIAVIDDGEPN